MIDFVGKIQFIKEIGKSDSRPFQFSDLSIAAHDWNAQEGVVTSGTNVDTWTDVLGGEVLQMSGTNRPALDTTGGFNTIDFTPDPAAKILSLDGDSNSTATLTAINGLTGYLAFAFKTTLASTGTLVHLATNARVHPYWTNGVTYVPKEIDDIANLSTGKTPLNEWCIMTINCRADGMIVRFTSESLGTQEYTTTAKNYNFTRFLINKRISGTSGYSIIRRILVGNGGATDSDNLLVEGMLAADLANAPA